MAQKMAVAVEDEQGVNHARKVKYETGSGELVVQAMEAFGQEGLEEGGTARFALP